MNIDDEIKALQSSARKLIRISQLFAGVCLGTMLISLTIQLTMGKLTGFTLAVDTFTVGLLGGTTSLLARAARALPSNQG